MFEKTFKKIEDVLESMQKEMDEIVTSRGVVFQDGDLKIVMKTGHMEITGTVKSVTLNGKGLARYD